MKINTAGVFYVSLIVPLGKCSINLRLIARSLILPFRRYRHLSEGN